MKGGSVELFVYCTDDLRLIRYLASEEVAKDFFKAVDEWHRIGSPKDDSPFDAMRLKGAIPRYEP